jgi:O-antigen/teichoic acid export membrane protein
MVTLAFTAILAPWFAPLLRPVVSGAVLREALRFGLPRIPHGVAHQTIAVADRYVLAHFVPLREIGLYSIGASFGLALKLFLSAFEYAWAPFYFATMRDPDARRVFSLVTTYGLAVLVLLVAGLSAVATDVVRLMTRPEFYPAARVVPWIGLGVLFQGVYLLTSIGLNITKQTALYPVATAAAAGASVAANLVLVPRFGAVGAAWSNALAYAVLAGVAMRLSQRRYPIRYEWDRILRIGLSGAGAWLAAVILVPDRLPALAGLLAHGTVVLGTYPALLWVLGFYAPREVALLAQLAARARRSRPPAAVEEATELAGEIVSATPDETEEAASGATPGEEAAAGIPDDRARQLVGAPGGRDDA